MARAGVTYHDVAKAAEIIKTKGQEPTVDRVREHLGTGSKSTIAPLLKNWRTDNGNTSDIIGLPNDLVEAVKSLHENLQQVADHRIEQARQEFNASSAELRKDVDDAGNTIKQFATRQLDLEKQVALLTRENSQQSRSLEDVRIDLAKAESKRDEAITRNTDLKETNTELKQENRDIRNHFEHYQQRTADDRQQEREQFRTSNQQLHEQIQELKANLTQARSRVSELQGTNTELQGSIDEIKKINVTLNNEMNRSTAEISDLKRDLEAALVKSQKYQNKKEQLTEQMAGLVNQKAYAEKEVAVLSQVIKATKIELKTAQERVTILTDENKLILQEKAVIQGQFKQLQNLL